MALRKCKLNRIIMYYQLNCHGLGFNILVFRILCYVSGSVTFYVFRFLCSEVFINKSCYLEKSASGSSLPAPSFHDTKLLVQSHIWINGNSMVFRNFEKLLGLL